MERIVDAYEYAHLVSNTNKQLVRDFLIEKRAQNKAKKTLFVYEANMRIILTMLYRCFDNKLLTELTRKDIRNLSIMFQERGLSSARVNALLCTLRSALEVFAEDEDIEYEHNIGSRVKGIPKDPVRTITFLSESQVHWLKDQLVNEGEILQAVYLMLSYVSAARKNEVHQVMKDELDKKFVTNVVIGKRRKKFRLYYDHSVQDLIREYLILRGRDAIPQLFVKLYKNGARQLVNPSTFNAWCNKMGEMLSHEEGKAIHINPHALRHSRLENLYRDRGIPIEKLKSLANHNDISTTESYLAVRQEDDIAEIFGMEPSLFAC